LRLTFPTHERISKGPSISISEYCPSPTNIPTVAFSTAPIALKLPARTLFPRTSAFRRSSMSSPVRNRSTIILLGFPSFNFEIHSVLVMVQLLRSSQIQKPLSCDYSALQQIGTSRKGWLASGVWHCVRRLQIPVQNRAEIPTEDFTLYSTEVRVGETRKKDRKKSRKDEPERLERLVEGGKKLAPCRKGAALRGERGATSLRAFTSDLKLNLG